MPGFPHTRAGTAAAVTCLLALLAAQLVFSVRGESQSWDEGDHIFAGYRSWTHGDFGLNPEHPPLVKLIATVPLLPLTLRIPSLQNRNFKIEGFLAGRDFVFGNDADLILFRTRMAAMVFTLALALLGFLAAREMFGAGAGLFALALLVFEPNLLAHGALVTTDVGLTCCLFAAVYAFYRYAKAPSVWRLAVTGVAAGLTLAAKHTGLLVLPILAVLAAAECFWNRRAALRLAAALVVVGGIAVVELWSFYGFRYQARPAGLQMNPPLARLSQGLKPRQARIITSLARWRVLPESYLYGLADVLDVADSSRSYVFGKVYPHGVWFYFPAAFAIKSTLGFLALLLLAVAAMATRRLTGFREMLFLTIPPAFYLLVAMTSGLNIGARHILPLYAFMAVPAAGAARAFSRQDRRWGYAVAALLVFHAVSSARCFPTYLAYANELWGGPSNTCRYLTDSNTDWAQQLQATARYLEQRGVKDCWFAYFAQTVVPLGSHGIPCRPLPTISSLWLGEVEVVPAAIDGPVLVSAGTLSGYETGPGALNPYDGFQKLRPTAVIQHGVFVYYGHFEIPLAAALTHDYQARQLLAAGKLEPALAEAQAAVAAEPDSVRVQVTLGDVWRSMNRPDEASAAYRKALDLAKTVEPEFQKSWIPLLQRRLDARSAP